jgi:hypothetical protein
MVRVLALAIAGSLAAAHLFLAAERQQPVDIPAAIERYATGDAAAPTAFPTQRVTVGQLTDALEAWSSRDPRDSRRRAVSSTFALEAVWAATRTAANANRPNLDPHGRTEPNTPDRVRITWFVAQGLTGRWSAGQLSPAGDATPAETAFWRSLLGFLADGSAWTAMLDVLPAIERRLPDDPRVKLSRVLAETSRRLGSLRAPGSRRNDLLSDDGLGTSVTRHIPGVLREFEGLLDVPEIAGEVRIRLAYLEMRRGRWKAALAHLERAHPLSTDPTLLATTEFFSGWIHERLGNPQAAIDAYRRAHAIVPKMRNLSTSLAKLLFLRHERADAYAILDTALNAQPSPQDLLVSLERGDARFVPDLLARARQAWR